jgi:hypothetical protein
MHFHRIVAMALIVAARGWGEAHAALCPPTPAPALQAQAQFLGSEDYFQAHGGNPRDLVIALYVDVLGRPPTENEIQRWSSRLTDCGNGVILAREFLIFAQSELAARYQRQRPPSSGSRCTWCRPDRPIRIPSLVASPPPDRGGSLHRRPCRASPPRRLLGRCCAFRPPFT